LIPEPRFLQVCVDSHHAKLGKHGGIISRAQRSCGCCVAGFRGSLKQQPGGDEITYLGELFALLHEQLDLVRIKSTNGFFRGCFLCNIATSPASGDLAVRDVLVTWEEVSLQVLRRTRGEARARSGDPWTLRLKRVRGKVGDDMIERVSTQQLFDLLEVAQRGRGAGACRRLARIMRELGWTAVRVRDLTRGGYKEQVRGYCRDPQSRHEFHHN
jgi:hypothetical protein